MENQILVELLGGIVIFWYCDRSAVQNYGVSLLNRDKSIKGSRLAHCKRGQAMINQELNFEVIVVCSY